MSDLEYPVYVGYDAREDDAYQVCKASILKHATIPVRIIPLKDHVLRGNGAYWREYEERGGQKYDLSDGKPFSTDFSFTRFLVPSIEHEGSAAFVDCDFLFRDDIAKLFALMDRKYAVQVVKHDYRPKETLKMDGQKQQSYPRKNWSSMILWNLDHMSNQKLTQMAVNNKSGRWLHGFGWLNDDEIGSLPEAWNWLEGHSSEAWEPRAVHYTRGVPSMPGYENTPYADEWRSYL